MVDAVLDGRGVGAGVTVVEPTGVVGENDELVRG